MRSNWLCVLMLFLPLQALAGVTCNTDDRVSISDTSALQLTSGDYTFAAWINPVDFGGLGRGRIFNKRSGSSGYNFILRDAVGTAVNTYAAAIDDSLSASNNIVWGPDNEVSTGVWQHIAFTYTSSGSGVQFYKNGVAITTNNGPYGGGSPDSDTTAFTICNNTTGDDSVYWHGSIDDAYVFTEALTAAQIKQLASSKLRGLALHNAKLLYLPMTNCAQGAAVNGTVFPDRSWNANAGTADDGANNTDMTCETMGAGLRYQRGVE